MNDRWVWNLESSGEFSVASIRRIIDEMRFPNIGDTTRWVKYVPIKVNILAWKIRCDVLPTRMNLSRRGVDIQDISCPICDYGVESSEHLFFRCNMIRDIGKQIVRWRNINYEEVSSYEEWKTRLTSCRMAPKLKQVFEGVCEFVSHELRLKREAAEKAFEASKDKDETIKSLEELRFLALSTKDLSDDDAYWVERKKAQIKAKLRAEMPMKPNNEDDSDE
nr:RNA-directed DNA polymerase, eukaryota [Tanacetum cinerariifolium]